MHLHHVHVSLNLFLITFMYSVHTSIEGGCTETYMRKVKHTHQVMACNISTDAKALQRRALQQETAPTETHTHQGLDRPTRSHLLYRRALLNMWPDPDANTFLPVGQCTSGCVCVWSGVGGVFEEQEIIY